MRDLYQEQLRTLHREMTEMGVLCVQSVALAIRVAAQGERELVERVREMEADIDKKERDIESLCLKLLLRQQPVATDLREVSSALKMISDLERIGDQAADIAELSQYTAQREEKAMEDLKAMAQEAIRMVSDSIEAFVKRDLALAREVIAYDDVVDRWFDRMKEDLVRAIAADGSQGSHWLDLLMAAKYLERIGDHATNIAEWVEYAILGRHARTEQEPNA